MRALMLNNLPVAYDLASAICDGKDAPENEKLACAYIAGLALARMGQTTAAEQYLRLTVQVETPQRDCLCEYGRVLVDLGEFASAATYFERAVQTDPTSAFAYRHLASTRWILGMYAGAIHAAQRGLDIIKDAPRAGRSPGTRALERDLLKSIGTSWQSLGDSSRAAAAYGKMMELHGEDLEAATTWLGFLNYIDCEREHLRTARTRVRELAQSAAPVGKAPFGPRWEPGQRALRIGVLSPDLRSHPVARFLRPLVQHLSDPALCEWRYYSNSSRHDGLSEELRATSAQWHECYAYEDGSLAGTIAQDQCDVLLDLAGWTGGSRVGVMAARLAPLQLTFLGWPDTTGISTIDACITDTTIGKTYDDAATIELPDCFVAWDAGDATNYPQSAHGADHNEQSPTLAAAETPVDPSTPLRLGSFNNPAKLSPRCLKLWARILDENPDATLLLKYHGLDQDINIKWVRSALQRYGVPVERVTFMGSQPSMHDHYRMYGQIDIALDTFPYNGTTTTCEALTTGVTVVTLHGSTPAGSVGASLLKSAGLSDWIATCEDEYAAKITFASSMLSTLRTERVGRRANVLASPLCDTHAWALRWWNSVSAAAERAGLRGGATSEPTFSYVVV
jgi:protein O-GlcNAc transferase